MKSEVTRTRQQIDQEHEATLRGLLGPATVARHAFIEARMTHQANRIIELLALCSLSPHVAPILL